MTLRDSFLNHCVYRNTKINEKQTAKKSAKPGTHRKAETQNTGAETETETRTQKHKHRRGNHTHKHRHKHRSRHTNTEADTQSPQSSSVYGDTELAYRQPTTRQSKQYKRDDIDSCANSASQQINFCWICLFAFSNREADIDKKFFIARNHYNSMSQFGSNNTYSCKTSLLFVLIGKK